MFIEKQRFNQWWLWLFILLPVLGSLGWALFKAVSSGGVTMISFSFRPDWLISLGICLLVAFFFKLMVLKTAIGPDGISVRFIPFHRNHRFYTWDQLQSCETRTYNPILEYGGWGVRFGPNGTAYNVRGKTGIQLVLKNGRKILIGTQDPSNAQKFIDQYFSQVKTQPITPEG